MSEKLSREERIIKKMVKIGWSEEGARIIVEDFANDPREPVMRSLINRVDQEVELDDEPTS